MATVTLDGDVYNGKYIVKLGPVRELMNRKGFTFRVVVQGADAMNPVFDTEEVAQLAWESVVGAMR